MGLIKVNHIGNFNKTEQFFNRVHKKDYLNLLNKYGAMGLEALKAVTPVVTGKTSESWNFGIEQTKDVTTLYWSNSNLTADGESVVILLVHGHGLQNGSYVEGNDFVSPALRSIFEDLANECWKEVTS